MPDDLNTSSGSGFRGIASGLMETYFGGLLRERERVDQDKKADQARQLAAFHALLEHPDTPESEIPNIYDSIAKLTKLEKEVAPITAHMREGMKRQVPAGPERETAGSQIARLGERVSAESMGLQPNLPAQEMYQPTAEYGSLTQAEAQRAAAMDTYRQQQDIQTEKMLQQQKAQTDRALAVAAQNEKARRDRLETEYKLKRDLLEPKERLAADKQRSQYKQALLSQLGHTPSEEEMAWADSKAGEMVINLADATAAQRAAAAEASRATAKNRLAQIDRWRTQNDIDIRREARLALGTDQRFKMFNANTKDDFTRLSQVRAELDKLRLAKAAGGAGYTALDGEIQAKEEERDDILVRINDAKEGLQSTGVPTAPAGSSGTGGRGTYKVDLKKFGLEP